MADGHRGRDEGRQHSVKDALKPLRDRVVHRLGGTMPERGLTYDQLVTLVYPSLPDELRAEVDAAAAGDLTSVTTIRRMLGRSSTRWRRRPSRCS